MNRALRGTSAGLGVAALATFAALAPAPSYAIDVTAVVSAIDAVVAPVGLIGAAILLVYVAIKAYKLVRRAM